LMHIPAALAGHARASEDVVGRSPSVRPSVCPLQSQDSARKSKNTKSNVRITRNPDEDPPAVERSPGPFLPFPILSLMI